MRSDQFREVVHDEASKDFLTNVLHFFSMKTKKAERIFQSAEGSLNTPALVVKVFDLVGIESFLIKICNDGLEAVIGHAEANDSEVQGKESVLVER